MEIEARVATREMGQIPVSIGTSLALEGAAGILEDKPVKPAPILRAMELWVNLRTVFRNLYGCLDTELRKTVLPAHLYPAMLEELQRIHTAVDAVADGKTRVVYYYCTYRSLPRRFPRARLRELTTELQHVYASIEEQTLKEVLAYADEDIRQFNIDLTGSHPSAFILTHFPIDLLSRRHFSNLHLLESHTGAIKGRDQWNTKLTNGKELARIPFDRMTLQVFGDGGQHFLTAPIKIRKVLMELAERYRWSPVTTKDKILYSVRQYRDPNLEAFILSLY